MVWRRSEPLLLASRSEVRRTILQAAGLPVETSPSDIDERALERTFSSATPADEVAQNLAAAKAAAVAAVRPGRIVLGADQTLSCEGVRFSKPPTRAAAREQLASLRGKTHELHAGISVFESGKAVFGHCDAARLTMRVFSDAFLDHYLELAGEAATTSVGGYQLEGTGIHLFEEIDGDYFTILGLPLLPLLKFFRETGYTWA